MSFEKSAYAVLGITKGASEKDVKNAYVSLVKKYDPEKHTERFMVIQQAYDKLRQLKTRATEDVYTLNMSSGEYLFQDDEMWTDPGPPEEVKIARLRADYLESPLDEEKKKEFCRLLFRRAHYLTRRKQLSEAIRDWSEVLDHDPSHARARHNLELACENLGISYAFHGLSDESIELLERALQLNPDNTSILHNLALISEQARDPDRTVRYWEETVRRWKTALEKKPEDEYHRSCIVEALNHQSDLNESGWLRRPKRQSRETVALPSRTEVSKPAVNTPRPAAETVRKPEVPASAESAPPAEQEARSHSRAGFEVSSIDRYREIVTLNPNDFDAHFQLCNKLMEQQLWKEAQDEIEKLVKKNPRNTEIWNLMGWAMLNNGQKDQAFNSWKRSLAIDPKNPATRDALVRANLMMGKAFRSKGVFTQALVHFKQLLALMPKSAEVHLEIAATYDMKGDVRSAALEYEQVIKLDPKNKVARKALNDLRMKR